MPLRSARSASRLLPTILVAASSVRGDAGASCPNSAWRSFGGSCYKQLSGECTFTECMDRCVDQGGVIARFTDNAAEGYLRETMLKDEYMWVGVFEAGEDESDDWQRVDGSASNFLNWNPGEPNNWCADEDCALAGPAWDGWVDVACDIDTTCVCEHGPSPSAEYTRKAPELEETGDPDGYDECEDEDYEDDEYDEDLQGMIASIESSVIALIVLVVMLLLLVLAMVVTGAFMYFNQGGGHGLGRTGGIQMGDAHYNVLASENQSPLATPVSAGV